MHKLRLHVCLLLLCSSLSAGFLLPRGLRGSHGHRRLATSDDVDFEALKAQIESMVPKDLEEPLPAPPSPASPDTGRRLLVAVSSFALGTFLFSFLHNQPASSVALLRAMERDSMALSSAICNGKPTVVDFYADWCESCKAMAPSMRALELQYKDSINFVTIDGSNPRNGRLVSAFRVDAIPHVAFVTPETEVKTALVGAVPKKVLEQDMEALLKVSSA